MDLLGFLAKSLVSLLSDPEHFGIVILTVSITLVLYFNNRGLRRGMNILADAATNAPKPPDPKVYGEAMAAKALELQQPTLDLWRENVALLTEDRERLKKELIDLRGQFNLFKTQSETNQKELSERIETLLTTIEHQKKELQVKDTTIQQQADQLKELETLKQQVAALTAEVTRLKEQVKVREQLESDLKTAQDANKQLTADLAAATQAAQAEKARADRLAADLQRTEQKLASAEAELIRVKATLPENQISARADIPPGYVAAPPPDVPEVPPARDGAA